MAFIPRSGDVVVDTDSPKLQFRRQEPFPESAPSQTFFIPFRYFTIAKSIGFREKKVEPGPRSVTRVKAMS